MSATPGAAASSTSSGPRRRRQGAMIAAWATLIDSALHYPDGYDGGDRQTLSRIYYDLTSRSSTSSKSSTLSRYYICGFEILCTS